MIAGSNQHAIKIVQIHTPEEIFHLKFISTKYNKLSPRQNSIPDDMKTTNTYFLITRITYPILYIILQLVCSTTPLAYLTSFIQFPAQMTSTAASCSRGTIASIKPTLTMRWKTPMRRCTASASVRSNCVESQQREFDFGCVRKVVNDGN